MDFKSLKLLAELPSAELTAKLVRLFGELLRYHDNNKALDGFDWHVLEITADGNLTLSNISEINLTEEERQRNYFDYAAIIYCVCTKQKSAESMSWDAGRKIKPPVLREIVLTICGRNKSIDPLIAKLREPYVDEESFFSNYSSVDEKEAADAFAKSEHIRRQNELDDAMNLSDTSSERSPWYKGIGVFILMALCVGGYRAYKAIEKQKHETAVELNRKMLDDVRKQREYIRSLPPAKLNVRSAKEDAADTTKQNDN